MIMAVDVNYLEAMLDQVIQAGLTLKDCWLERSGCSIEDDPYVEDACSTIESVRQELRELS
jgi:hypothetical protein